MTNALVGRFPCGIGCQPMGHRPAADATIRLSFIRPLRFHRSWSPRQPKPQGAGVLEWWSIGVLARIEGPLTPLHHSIIPLFRHCYPVAEISDCFPNTLV